MNKKFLFLYSFGLFILSILILSCSENTKKRLEITPMAYGSIDNIYMVCNESLWMGAVGDSFRNQFEALYPVTPQPEPLFDVRFIDAAKFNKVHRTHRAIIILADLSDKNDKATEMIRTALGNDKIQQAMTNRRYRIAFHKNRWAMGQVVVYWFAPNKADLLESVSKDYKQVTEIINKLDAETLSKQVYANGQSPRLNDSIKNTFGFEMKIPSDFEIAYRDSNTIWLFEDRQKSSNNILIHSISGIDNKKMSKDSLIAIRNRLSKKYFSSWAEGSFMEVDDENLPIYFSEMLFQEMRALQARGIWRMEKDFMGGPFATYMLPDAKNNRIIFIDAFVYAPGQKKRPEMRRMDAIFSTFKLP
jgi:hypothetical protein